MSENKEYITHSMGQSKIHISKETICTVAAMAAVEVDGVAGLSHLGKDIASIAAKKHLTRVVCISTDGEMLTVDLSILVSFGSNIPTVAKNVQTSVSSAVESVAGLEVSAVNVHISGIEFEK